MLRSKDNSDRSSMKLEEITIKEFDDFAKKHPQNNFLQSSQMGSVSKVNGWTSYYVGIKKNNKLIAACRLGYLENRFHKRTFSVLRGPLMDYSDDELLSFFTQEIKKFVKDRKGYELDISPAIIHKTRDIDGNVVSGENHSDLVTKLIALGYKHDGFITSYDYSKQVRWMFVLDLEHKSEQEIFKEMKQNHRNIIKKTERFCIEIKELTYDELSIYKKITEDTSERRNFEDKSLAYYEAMYKTFHDNDEIKFLVAYLNVEAYEKSLKLQLANEEKKYAISANKDANSGKTKELGILINSLKKRIDEAIQIGSEKGYMVPLSAAMFLMYGDEITYMFSGSYKEYMNFYAQYAIQWYMIKYGIQHQFKCYNFYGITGCFDPKDPEYGVYEFKKGFNGYVREYIGDFVLPLSAYHKVDKLIKKVKA